MPAHRDDSGHFGSVYPPDVADTRYCPLCDDYLPMTRFYADKRILSGYTRRCRRHHSAAVYASRKRRKEQRASLT
jgi:hypothetical protein